jgi:hypothetical protein
MEYVYRDCIYASLGGATSPECDDTEDHCGSEYKSSDLQGAFVPRKVSRYDATEEASVENLLVDFSFWAQGCSGYFPVGKRCDCEAEE